jgi:archaellum biogenesis ATPase FlaH
MQSKTRKIAVEKIPTGIRGLDEALMGGVPKGRSTLITGGTGTGKTVILNEFLYQGITQFKENGVYVAFEESKRDIIKNGEGGVVAFVAKLIFRSGHRSQARTAHSNVAHSKLAAI